MPRLDYSFTTVSSIKSTHSTEGAPVRPILSFKIFKPKLGYPDVPRMSPPTFILTIGDFGVTDEKFGQGFASCQQATEDKDGAALLLYLACQTFIDLQFIQQFINLFSFLLYTAVGNLILHCTE